jgi:hypothetical protein
MNMYGDSSAAAVVLVVQIVDLFDGIGVAV